MRVRTSVASSARTARQPGSTTVAEDGFEDQRGAVDRLAGAELVAAIGRPRRRVSIGAAPPPGAARDRRRSRRAGDRLDRQRVDAPARPDRRSRSAGGEASSNAARIASERPASTSIVVSLPGARRRARRWRTICAGAKPCATRSPPRRVFQLGQPVRKILAERPQPAHLADRLHVGQADAIGRQHARRADGSGSAPSPAHRRPGRHAGRPRRRSRPACSG